MLGPWRNGPWLNALATLVVAVLILLSLILMATTVFPSIDVPTFALYGAIVMAVVLAGFAAATLRSRRRAAGVTSDVEDWGVPREHWTMPPLALLDRPTWSTSRKVAMLALRAYLVVSIVILIYRQSSSAGGSARPVASPRLDGAGHRVRDRRCCKPLSPTSKSD